MIDTSDFLTASECTKFVYGLGSAKDPLPLGRNIQRSPRRRSWFREDPTFNVEGRQQKKRGGSGTGEGTAP